MNTTPDKRKYISAQQRAERTGRVLQRVATKAEEVLAKQIDDEPEKQKHDLTTAKKTIEGSLSNLESVLELYTEAYLDMPEDQLAADQKARYEQLQELPMVLFGLVQGIDTRLETLQSRTADIGSIQGSRPPTPSHSFRPRPPSEMGSVYGELNASAPPKPVGLMNTPCDTRVGAMGGGRSNDFGFEDPPKSPVPTVSGHGFGAFVGSISERVPGKHLSSADVNREDRFDGTFRDEKNVHHGGALRDVENDMWSKRNDATSSQFFDDRLKRISDHRYPPPLGLQRHERHDSAGGYGTAARDNPNVSGFGETSARRDVLHLLPGYQGETFHGYEPVIPPPIAPPVPQNPQCGERSRVEDQLQRLTQLVAEMASNYTQRPPVHEDDGIKLPQIGLPKFSGTYGDFDPFWDIFDRAVNSKRNLSGAQKFTHLKSCCTGDALKLIGRRAITDENYPKAVESLKLAFGNKNVAIDEIKSKLFSLPSVPHGDFSKLRSFYFDVESLLDQLEVLGEEVDSPHVVGVLMPKLSRELIRDLERSKGLNRQWSTTLLKKLLFEEMSFQEAGIRKSLETHGSSDQFSSGKEPSASAEAFVSTDRGGQRGSKGSKRKSNNKKRRGKDEDAQSDHQTDEKQASSSKRGGNAEAKGKGQPYCCFCKRSNHYSDECRTVPSLEERNAIVKEEGRCFLCLNRGHGARFCDNARTCYYCKTDGKHHQSLCPAEFGRKRSEHGKASTEKDQAAGTGPTRDLTERDLGSLATDEMTVMKTVVAEVGNPETNCKKRVRMFLDCGSSRSYITTRLAKALELRSEVRQTLLVDRFGDPNEEPLTIEISTAKLDVWSRNGDTARIWVAISDKAITQISRKAVPAEVMASLPDGIHLADSPLTESETVDVDILIGNDYYDDFVMQGKILLPYGFKALESEFGWILSGRLPDPTKKGQERAFRKVELPCPAKKGQECAFREIGARILSEPKEFKTRPVDDIEEALKGFPGTLEDLWSLEAIGIRDNPNPVSDDDAIETFNRTVQFKDGRYYVTWPWNRMSELLPTNYNGSYRRLKTLLSSSKKRDRMEYLRKYDAVMQDQLSKDVIEEVIDLTTDYKLHYLAHHGVETPWKATTKIRVVFDASAKERPDLPSLNESMHRGQVYVENLIELLIRFREYPIAIVSDIEKAFLQICLQDSEKDVTRFLWVRDVEKEPVGANLVTMRFKRVSFGVVASPFLLGVTVLHHLSQENSPVARMIETSIYVDNIICGAWSEEEAIHFYEESRAIFQKASMNLREFGSNSKEFLDKLPPENKITDEETKILGVRWNSKSDQFLLSGPQDSPKYKENQEPTKRTILADGLKGFDPLGLATPVNVRTRMLLQKIQKLKIGWNAELNDEFKSEWEAIKTELMKLSTIAVPRCFGFQKNCSKRLMVFCDASKKAYATAVYVQGQRSTSESDYDSHLVFAKARVCPDEKMTIPRLELMGVLIGVRAVRYVRNALKMEGRVVVWCDNQSVLAWLSSRKMKGSFVENRLREIRKEPNVEYRYVPSEQNPADRASRGTDASEIDDVWLKGPAWASKDESHWPDEFATITPDAIKKADDEENPTEEEAMAAQEREDVLPSPFLMDATNYSTLNRLLRVTAYCQRAKAKFMKQKTSEGDLTVKEQDQALAMWLEHVQSLEFSGLKKTLETGRTNRYISDIGVEIGIDGLLRCRGRAQHAGLGGSVKLLLPSRSTFTMLVIMDHHYRCMHAGVSQTLAQVRQDYWIPKSRTRVKSALNKCRKCRRHQGPAFARPKMPSLPVERVNRQRVFSSVGLDYFGPVHVKNNGVPSKRWVCLLTCLTTRALHLEVVHDMTAEEFVMALRRFVARRGCPDEVTSDNAPHFKAADGSQVFKQELSGRQIQWKFIPEFSPWSGGFYERMVGLTKTAMKKAIGRKMVNDQQLLTMVHEAENAVNSRPLTYVEDDIDYRVISPNTVLGLESKPPLASFQVDSEDEDYEAGRMGTREQLLKVHRRMVNTVEMFWKIWTTEYLQELQTRLTWQHKDPRVKRKREPKIGEVVLVKDEGRARCLWELGRVDELVPSHDGLIRAVKVRMPSGRVLTRPVNLLHPLECEDKAEEQPQEEKTEGSSVDKHEDRPETNDNGTTREAVSSERPRRRAALQSAQATRAMLRDESIEHSFSGSVAAARTHLRQ